MNTEFESFGSLKCRSIPPSTLFQGSASPELQLELLDGSSVSTELKLETSECGAELEGTFIIFHNYLYLTKKAARRYSQFLNGPKYYLRFFFLGEQEELFLLLM